MNFRNSFAIVFAYCWIISGCTVNDPAQKKDSLPSPPVHDTVSLSAGTAKADTEKDTVVNTANAIGCYYVLENQYAGSPDSAALMQWLDPFVAKLSETGISSSGTLFSEGAGPNGAQWNPGADLLVVAYVNGIPQQDKIVYSVNGYDMRKFPHGVKISEKGNAAVCWFIIPERSWEIFRHQPTAEDVKAICRQQHKSEKDWIKNAVTLINVSMTVPVSDSVVSFSDRVLMSFGE